ncbi:MAG: hypothetical protein LBD77_01275, partial [Bifidobacteriaceae bacterium]|nr:hypothetical protein [Bifidobacteriaceae bacterium]
EGGDITAIGGKGDSKSAVGGAGVGGGFGRDDMGDVVITGGTLTAIGGAGDSAFPGRCGAGIGSSGALVSGGSTADGDKPPTVAIGESATVRAYSACSSHAAIHAVGDNQANPAQYFVNAQFDSSLSNTAGVDLDVYARGAAPIWETLKLPVGYVNFAYTTGSTSSQTDSINAYAADRTWLGRVVTAGTTPSTKIASGIAATPLAVTLAPNPRTERLSLSTVMTGAWTDPAEGPFSYKVTVLDAQGSPAAGPISYTGGVVANSGATAPQDSTITLDSNGVGSVTLGHGQAVNMEIEYQYEVRVQQTGLNQFTTSNTVDGEASADNLDTGLVRVDAAKAVAFTNERKTGVLTISNAVTGLLADPELEFSFKVCVLPPNGSSADWTQFAYSVDGGLDAMLTLDANHCSASDGIVLKGGQAATMTLPGEATVRVTEQGPPSGYAVKHAINGGDSAVSGDSGDQPMNNSNLSIAFTNERESADLTVSKVVAGAYADRTQSYKFKLCFWTPDATAFGDNIILAYSGGVVADSGATAPADGDLELVAGCGTVELGHGQSITLTVPKRTQFKVEETPVTGYTASYKLDGGQTVPGGDFLGSVDQSMTIAFTNTRATPPVPSGVDAGGNGLALWGVALGAGLVWAPRFLRVRRRAGSGRVMS